MCAEDRPSLERLYQLKLTLREAGESAVKNGEVQLADLVRVLKYMTEYESTKNIRTVVSWVDLQDGYHITKPRVSWAIKVLGGVWNHKMWLWGKPNQDWVWYLSRTTESKIDEKPSQGLLC